VKWKDVRVEARRILMLSIAGLLLTAAACATFYNWSAESGWGDRFLTTWVWVGCALAVPLLLELNVPRRVVAALLSFALVLQLASVVFPSWLEEMQLRMYDVVVPGKVTVPDGQFDHFVIGQRFRNILDKAAGSDAIHDPMIVPVMPLRSLPRWTAAMVRVGWFGLSFVLILLVRRLVNLREAR
jgi:hypothetical protein